MSKKKGTKAGLMPAATCFFPKCPLMTNQKFPERVVEAQNLVLVLLTSPLGSVHHVGESLLGLLPSTGLET